MSSLDLDILDEDGQLGLVESGYFPADSGEFCPPPFTCWELVRNRLTVQGEFLLWWTDAMSAPALVTTSPVGTAPNVAGVLGQPGTTVLYGDGGLEAGPHAGGRITLSWALLSRDCEFVQASYLAIGQRTSSFSGSSPEFPILARPVFNTQLNAPAAMLVAHPDFLAGSLNVAATTELQAGDIVWRGRLFDYCGQYLDLLGGYRFATLDESLRFDQSSRWTAAQPPIVVGTTRQLFDLFDARNEFNGGQIGLVYERGWDCWSVQVAAKLALGNNRSVVRIDGATVVTVPQGGSATFAGGLLAQTTNMGQYEQNKFAVMPELGVTLVRDISCRMRLKVGYNLLYWTAVARPGEQIDPQVSQFPPEPPVGARRPQFQFHTSNFWAQGLHCGLEYQF